MPGMLGDTKQYLFSFCRLFAFCDQSFVGLVVIQEVYHVARKEFGISVFLDADLLQHLANDNLDMLIVDFYTLQTVNSLYLADHVILNGTYTFDLQDIMRVDRTLGQLVSGFQNCSVCDLNTGS